MVADIFFANRLSFPNSNPDNIAVFCPTIATFVKTCYTVPACLFVIGDKELLFKEGTMQGNPTAMGA